MTILNHEVVYPSPSASPTSPQNPEAGPPQPSFAFQMGPPPIWKTPVPSPPSGGHARPDSAFTQQAHWDCLHPSASALGTLDSLFGQVDRLPGEVCHISLGAHLSNPGQAPWGAWQGNFRVSRGTFGSCSRRLLCSRVLGIQSSQVLVLARPLFSEYPGYTESDLSPPPALCWGQCVRVLNFPLSESSFPYVYTLLHTFPHCSAHTV